MPRTDRPAHPRRRRRLLGWVVGVMVSLLALTAAGGVVLWFTFPVDTVDQVDFDRELHVPPLADSTLDEQGRRAFDLTAEQGTADLGAGPGTGTWGFNGDHLGPTLRAERGEEVVVNVRNHLPETTTVHWHGMHLPAAMDGGPHQEVEPGGHWSPTWTIDQPAASLWYHPHPHGHTAEHVTRGLVGMFILDDETESALELPRDYGVDDLPVMVQDVGLDGEGNLQILERGSDLLVNGTPGPYVDVTTERLRLRLLNASVQRSYEFVLDDGSSFDQIASDGGLLPATHRTDRVLLSPGERAEVVIAMEPGTTRVLRSQPPDLGLNSFFDRSMGGADQFDVLQLRAAQDLEPSPPVPEELVPDITAHAGRADQVAHTRTFELQGRSINDAMMDMERVDEVVTAGDTEVWEVVNTDMEGHNFHVHDVQFRVLSVDGQPPEPALSGLKDTVYLPPGVPVELLMTFRQADPDLPYMYHCHMLTHEDQGMMGQFLVVADGQEPASRWMVPGDPGFDDSRRSDVGHDDGGRHEH